MDNEEKEMNAKWGVYPWFAEQDIELIHPDDLESFKLEVSNTKVFKCIEEGEYITLWYNNHYYRVKDKLFRPVPAPTYSFGDIVNIKESGVTAVIADIMWHYDKQEHYYFVSVRNTKKSRRYFEAELSLHHDKKSNTGCRG